MLLFNINENFLEAVNGTVKLWKYSDVDVEVGKEKIKYNSSLSSLCLPDLML